MNELALREAAYCSRSILPHLRREDGAAFSLSCLAGDGYELLLRIRRERVAAR